MTGELLVILVIFGACLFLASVLACLVVVSRLLRARTEDDDWDDDEGMWE
jgi:hypothetical protein